ncbi:FAD-dependent oxidoreductase [Eggerthellaceae bacterium 24-137]
MREGNRSINPVSRRSFIAGAGALGAIALATAAGCAPKTKGEDKTPVAATGGSDLPGSWDMEADIVIVGAGGAGMAAACTAKEAGSSVLVLEKGGVTGGDTALCGQAALGPWISKQQEAGIDESVELYLADMANSYSHGAFAEQGRDLPAEAPFTQLQTELTEEMFEWTSGTIGIAWQCDLTSPVTEGVLPQPTWDTVIGRSWMAQGPEGSVMDGFNKAVESMGIDVRLRTEVDRLIKNSDGRVVGVWAYDENDLPIAVKAAKAVIVATGSFCSNRGMMERYLPVTRGIQGGGCYGVTGDGVRMVRNAGGAVSELDLGCHWYPYEASTNSGQFSTTLIFFGGLPGQVPISQQPGVLLNYDGERFVSESDGYHLIGRATAQQPGQESWYVFDSSPAVAEMILGIIQYNNRVVQADTLDELWKITRLPADAAAASIEAYNAAVADGSDEAFGKLLDGCQPVAQGPFYAINIRPKPYCTYGGVDTDLDARVVDESGAAIPGLYAAGVVTGSYAAREGFYYNGGLAQALIFGRLAGKNAAADEAWEAASPTGAESEDQGLNEMARCGDCHGDTRAPGEPNYHNF